MQAADTKSTSVAGEASGIDNELARLRTATRLAFAIVAGLLIALVATLLMIFGRRKRANNATLAANAKRRSVATAAGSLPWHCRGGRTAAPGLCPGGRRWTFHHRAHGIR